MLFLFAYCGLAVVALPAGGLERGAVLVWPAAGLLVAILLHAPHRQWPEFLTLAAVGSVAAALLTGSGYAAAASMALANVLEAWFAARLLRRRKRHESELLREWLADAGAIGAVAPVAGGLVLATLLYRLAGWPWELQFARYVFAHALGIMAFFPMFSLLVGGGFAQWFVRQPAGRRFELFAFLGLIAVTTCAALWQAGLAAYLVPILASLIAICRFGMKAGSVAIFTIAVAGWGAFVAGTQVHAVLPAALSPTELADERFLQFYLALAVLCLQPLAGHITQNRRLASALRERGQASTAVELSLQAKDFAIAESQGMYRLLAENMSDIVIKTDHAGYILYASPSAERLGEFHPIELIGRHVLDLIHPSYGASFQSEFDEVIGGSVAASAWTEFLGFSNAGLERWFDTRIRGWRDRESTGDRKIAGTIITMRSIEERKALEQQLFAAILTDPLTNLTNRRAFNSMLQYHLEAPIDGCLAIFDIDDFRSINREYGHEVGDKVLTTVARLLRSLMRKDDIISRIGGERFAVLLSGANPDQAEALCQRVVMTLADISGPEGLGGPKTTVSAGVARIRGSLDETMKRADSAVVIAKAKGRNRLEMATNGRQRWSPGQVPWIEDGS
ncbi:MAG: diguanylate cyclase [Novosphingobium sp.]|nr:diguanylate cyclase [Novosphingobium sp.]